MSQTNFDATIHQALDQIEADGLIETTFVPEKDIPMINRAKSDLYPTHVLEIDLGDIPKADERDEWDIDQEPAEPEELYPTDEPAPLFDADGVEYQQIPLPKED